MRPYALFPLLLLAPLAADAQFRHEPTGFQISPPDWMYRQGEDLLAPPSRISCWGAPSTEESPWITMCVERLDRLPRADEKLSFHWKDRTLRGSRTLTRAGKDEVVQYSALIPLRLETVRLDVVVPVRGADEAKAVLQTALDSVVDVGLWTAPGAGGRSTEERTARSLGRLTGKIGMGLVIAGVGLWIRGRRARRKEQAEGDALPQT